MQTILLALSTRSLIGKIYPSIEKVTQTYGLTMSVKKTVIMSLEKFDKDATGRIVKSQPIRHPTQTLSFEIGRCRRTPTLSPI